MTTNAKSEILQLAFLAAYQTGAVVSRQVVKTEGGNITLFVFDEGQALSEHTTPYDAFVHILEGQAEITISGKPFLLGAGEGILMPANSPHALHTIKRFKMLLTMLHA